MGLFLATFVPFALLGCFGDICMVSLARGGHWVMPPLKPTKCQIDYRLISDALNYALTHPYTYKIEKTKQKLARVQSSAPF